MYISDCLTQVYVTVYLNDYQMTAFYEDICTLLSFYGFECFTRNKTLRKQKKNKERENRKIFYYHITKIFTKGSYVYIVYKTKQEKEKDKRRVVTRT